MENQNLDPSLNPQPPAGPPPPSAQVPGPETPAFETAPPAVSQSSSEPAATAPPLASSKKSLLIGSIALAVLLVGAGAAAYFLYPVSPEKVLGKMMNSLPQVTSGEYSGKLEFDISGDITDSVPPLQPMQFLPPESNEKRQIKFTVELEGKFDSSDINAPKSSANVKISGEGLVLSGEVISIGSTAYFKLVEFPLLGFFDPGEIKNQWYKFDSEEFEKQAGIRDNPNKVTPEQQRKIIEALAKYTFFKVEEKLKSEQISAVNTHHYLVSIDENQLMNFLKETAEIMGKPITDAEMQEIRKGFEAVNFSRTELWIGKKDNLPYRTLLVVDFKDSQASDVSGVMTLDVSTKNYNQPVNIQAPANAKDLNELFSSSFPASPMLLPPATPDGSEFSFPPDFDENFDFELDVN